VSDCVLARLIGLQQQQLTFFVFDVQALQYNFFKEYINTYSTAHYLCHYCKLCMNRSAV
jgi:hypothetical protein